MCYLIFFGVFALGFWLGMILMACLAMAGRRGPEPEPQSFTTLDLPLDMEADDHSVPGRITRRTP
jgi:hypothetical protein